MAPRVDDAMPDQADRESLEKALHLDSPLNTNVHPNDQMLTFITSARGSESIARSDYFTSGVQLLKILEQLVKWKFGSFDNLPTFLDFAGGYGRLTRFLVHKLPPDRIWVSDIQADAVAFQRAEFGVHGFVSTTDPADLVCDHTFDCIYVASLFSHLPAVTFTPWLKKLYTLLKPGGLLAFSLHDESRLPKGQTMPDSGIWFGEASEIATLDTKEYGITIVSEAFVRKAIVEATGHRDYRRIPYGMQYHQDLYLVLNDPKPDFSALHFAYPPHGGIDYAIWSAPGELQVAGWAMDISGDGSQVEVQISVDGQLRQKCLPFIPRPDVQAHFSNDRFLYTGWECSFHLPDDDPTRIMVIQGVSSNRDKSLLYVGTIASLERPTGPNYDQLLEDLHQLQAALDQRLEDLHQLQAALDQHQQELQKAHADQNERLNYIRHLEAEIARKNAALAELEARMYRRPWQRR
jgi:SAM-dependent methyltransferase